MIRVGTAGWNYKDWNGIVYPAPRPKGFSELEFLSRYFDCAEINSSYYGSPKPTTTRSWLEQVSGNPQFRFTAKLLHNFTHERKPAPKDEAEFRDGMAPLVEAGKLGALLIQFPWSFKNEPETATYLWKLLQRFADYPLVIEVRHSSWITDDVLNILAERGIGIANIDQPLFHRSVKPAAHATAKIAYVRLHGRNYQQWFSKTADVRARYDYLYSVEELEPWADRIRMLSEDATETYAIGNNHNLGKAVTNGLEIKALLGQPVKVPETLVERYPDLKTLNDPASVERH
jgi:uncharacterized protein YecE (DUF72 family)